MKKVIFTHRHTYTHTHTHTDKHTNTHCYKKKLIYILEKYYEYEIYYIKYQLTHMKKKKLQQQKNYVS